MHLDTTQQEIAGALKDNTVLLAEVSPTNTRWDGVRSPSCSPTHLPLSPLQVQKTMKENLAIVEDSFADIDTRIKQLQK